MRPYDSLARIMMDRGYMPSAYHDANSLIFTKNYVADDSRRVTVTAEVDKPGPFGRVTKLSRFRISIEAVLDATSEAVAVAPTVCRDDLTGILAALAVDLVDLPTVSCVVCGNVVAQFYVEDTQILCTECKS